MDLGTEKGLERTYAPATVEGDINLTELLAETKSFEGVMSDILGKNKEKTLDAETLKTRKAALQDECREAMLEGNVALVLKIRNQLRDFDDLILAASFGDSRKILDQLTSDIAEVKKQNEELMALRAEQNKVLREKLDAAHEVQNEVTKIEYAIASSNLQLESLRIGRNEIRERLEQLAEQQKETHTK